MSNSSESGSPAIYATGTLLDSRYEVVRRLGSGGMGQVYEVLDHALGNERLALKLLAPALDSDATDPTVLNRFQNEVLITRRLAHPNIVRSFDFGNLSDGRFYMTMEYVKGETLEQKIQADFFQKSNIEFIVLILMKIAEAIGFAHKLGIIHRDLKSANILISDSGEVKITDFGLAQMKSINQRLTMTGECVGTPVYMSPEQVQGQAVDHRVDIYALGIIAFELVVGRVPFSEESWYGLATKIVHQPTPDFATKENGVPPWYQSFVQRASAKKPNERFQSAEEALDFLRGFIFGADTVRVDAYESKASKRHTSRERANEEATRVRSVARTNRGNRTVRASEVPKASPFFAVVMSLFLVFVLASIGVKGANVINAKRTQADVNASVIPDRMNLAPSAPQQETRMFYPDINHPFGNQNRKTAIETSSNSSYEDAKKSLFKVLAEAELSKRRLMEAQAQNDPNSQRNRGTR